ncbi:MAG: hypothetical protein L6R40_006416 [Gallowayella cf. fulva]|nr:MAG: hypothetical protein L6R40_006416 [Xanthomendoza cf. fulva]
MADLDHLDVEILALAGEDSSDEETCSGSKEKANGRSSLQANTGSQEEYAELIQTGYNLRRRSAVEESPYLAPWQLERQRKRRERSGILPGMENKDMGTSDTSMRGMSKPARPQPARRLPTLQSESDKRAQRTPSSASTGETDRKIDGFALLLQAAILKEQNDIPCSSSGCPVAHPHGEGLYQYEGEVPNSDLANAYFAPSIPPPVVVEAFNNDRPSWNDIHTKDHFFNYHTIPCRPSKHLRKVSTLPCTSEHCGVEGPHKKGLYLEYDLDASLFMQRNTNHIFGLSNPPLKVWDAALRMKDNNATERDNELVRDFSAHHSRWEDGVILNFPGGTRDNKWFVNWQKEWKSRRP